METYVIEAPEGFEAVAKVVSGVTNISFIPKVVEKKLPINLNQSISYLPEICYYIDNEGDIMDFEKKQVADGTLAEPNTITSEEYAKAFLALMQLIRFRDIWNEGWIADWTNVEVTKHVIRYDSSSIISTWRTTLSSPLVFKTSELGDKFLETFKDLIETAKPIL